MEEERKGEKEEKGRKRNTRYIKELREKGGREENVDKMRE